MAFKSENDGIVPVGHGEQSTKIFSECLHYIFQVVPSVVCASHVLSRQSLKQGWTWVSSACKAMGGIWFY